MRKTTLFLCGDVMTGRGIDQILAHPGDPQLFEATVKSARDYVALAERESGRIDVPVDDAWVWGDAPALLAGVRPQVAVINLETAVTANAAAWPHKAVHYRMHPANIGVIAALKPDCCVLANNHVLDWGRQGLLDTLDALQAAGLRGAGAGRNREEAAAPAIVEVAGAGRVLIFARAMADSGVPATWAATDRLPGVAWLAEPSSAGCASILAAVARHKRDGDVAVVSLHWGPNWGYEVPPAQQDFARRLVEGGVDIVHGHSSHHPLGIEVHRQRLILYGCGDFLNDYEGIGGHRDYRPELTLMYFPTVAADSGRLLALELVPTRIRQLRVERADEEGIVWLQRMLDREGRRFGTRVDRHPDRLQLRWD